MSSDASDDIIPDSQESANEDNEPILTIPSVINTPSVAPSNGVILDNNNEIHSNDNLENTTYVQSNATKSLDASTINISGRSAITPDKHLSENLYAPQRSLRKRTAIQRMPYSLERIKHRQLLEGYDVSSFDTVSNQVDISALEKRNENVINTSLMRDINQVRDNMVNHEDELFEYNMGIVSDDSDLSFEEDDYDISIRDQNTQSNSDVSLLTSSIVPAINDAKYNEEDDILFRGKRLKVKTGYRGILPKMVWEKQLSSVGTKSKTLKRKSRHHGGKGVAVKKKTKTTTGQDNSLLNELISDGYASEDSDDFEIYHQVQNLEAQETPALVELDMYYHNKYDNNYLSDTSLTDEFDGNILTKSPNLEFTRETFFTDMDHGQVPLIHDGNLNNDVLEDNRSAFNPLLSSRKDQSPPRAKQLKENSGIVTRKPLSKRKNIIRRVSIKKYRHPRIRTSHEKSTPINLQPMYPGNHLSVQNNEGAEEEEERGDKKEKKVRKTNHYGSNRNTTTYNTVVEALSGKFGSTSHKNSGITKDHEISNDIIIIPELPSLEILDVFFKKTNLTPPKTVSISLNNVTYVLSRFNTNEIEGKLQKIFSCIISQGSTEDELFDIFKKLTNFLWQLNIPSLHPTIEDFHSKFRGKLNSLRQNAKSIHFYILAVCQLMLLEVSKYANLALVYKEKIERAILNHTASFFSILSLCYDKLIIANTEILNQSYDIMATIVDELKKKDALWTIFNEKKFIPDVVRLLCNIFPTKKPQWNVIKIEATFSGVRKTLSLVRYCYHILNWEVQNSLILKIHEVFKVKRFFDFEDEKLLSQKNKVRINPEAMYSCKTTFNGYLLLLSHMEVSNSLLERLTPISKLIIQDTSSALVNRFNLLVLLAHKSKLNYENRFQLIVTQLIDLKFIATLSPQDNNQVCQAVLNTTIFFMLNNSKKHIPLNCKVVSMTFIHLLSKSPIRKQLWKMFLMKARQIISKHKTIWPKFNKALYKCFAVFSEETDDKEMFLLFLKIYIDNLKETSSKWLQANLFPLLKHKAEISIDYVNYYCEVGDYLIKSGELNWWQFITFNGLEHNENIRFYFISKVIELCDVASFKNIEKDFYRLIVNNIETSYDNDHFWNLCKVLLFKADNTSSTFDITTKKNMLSYFPFWKKVFKVLGDLNFKGLVRALMEKVANLYATEKIERTCTERIITYLDGKYFQDLQDIKTFNHLRAVFNISNKDMENNEFKKSLSELPNITEQVLHIEQAVLLADYDDVIEEKVLSLFSSTGSFHLNPYRIIITAIMANGRKETRSLDVFIKRMKMANFLLSTMLKANLEKFYQLKKNEYLESIQLVRFICLFHRFDNVASMQSKIYSRFMTTSATFILQMSSISMGFDESYIIGTYMENNWFPSDLKNHTARVDPPPKELIDKIEKMLEEDSSSVADDSYSNSPKENNKFADFIALLKDNL
ncbi:E3 ubiquitin-protein ligase substrate receptor Mms22p [Monosporozyma unispora]